MRSDFRYALHQYKVMAIKVVGVKTAVQAKIQISPKYSGQNMSNDSILFQ